MFKVTSEIFEESAHCEHQHTSDGRVLTAFHFHNSNEDDDDDGVDNDIEQTTINGLSHDKDGDLIVKRRRRHYNAQLNIEHHEATELRLVGLQVWRGALLLADYLYHKRADWQNYKLLELGAGVGLTSIAAAALGQHVICTDVNIGGLLELIRANVKRNSSIMRGSVQVLEYDFMQAQENYSNELIKAIDECDLVAAADVIYDNALTDAFINVLEYIFERETHNKRQKIVLVALEKRYVFTLSDMETVPPMFDYFLCQLNRKPSWRLQYIPTDFKQYFDYKRCKQLVLFQITSGCNYK